MAAKNGAAEQHTMRFHQVTGLFPRMADDEFAALVKDIAAGGLHEAIWTWKGEIIDGVHRYLACVEAGIEPRYREWNGKGDLIEFVISQNLHRRHLSESQRARVAADVATMQRGGDKPSRNDANFDSANLQNRNVSQAKAAEMFNVSTRLVADATKVKDDGVPELDNMVKHDQLTVSPAAKIASRPKSFQLKVVRKLKAGIKPMEAMRQVIGESSDDKKLVAGKKRYRVVYADPPWQYGNTQVDGFKEQRDHYRTMTLDEICAMPVKEMVEDDGILFLWVTAPILEDAFKVVAAWGFRYKTNFVWDKVGHVMGHYSSVRHEHLLVCTRGSCQPDVHKLFDSVQTIERAEHSAKPEEFRAIIDTIYPHGNRIELFARKRVKNWDCWGNQV